MLQPSQATGGPGWLDTDRYDIDTAHLQPLLQNLLADRFALSSIGRRGICRFTRS